MRIYRGKLQHAKYAENEGITVIFPSGFSLGDPVYMCWQWTVTAADKKKEPCFYNSTIDGVFTLPNNIGFSYDGDYKFNADISDIKNVPFTMQDSSSKEIVSSTSLHIAYESNLNVDTAPRIYVGKLDNYAPYLVDEMIVVVAPESLDEGNKICAFWQWTETKNGAKKENLDLVTTISDVKSVDNVGESFRFYQGENNYYTFDATVREMNDQLVLNMKDNHGATIAERTLTLQDLKKPPGRQRRFAKTTEVYNDSNEIVVCSLTDSGSSLTDQILATASLLLGGVGLLAALPSGLPVAIGTYAAVVGWYVAIGGMIQVMKPSSDDVAGVLFPQDKLTRRSSFWSDNNLHINLARIEGSKLVISTAILEKAGDTPRNLQELLPGGSSAPPYNKLFEFGLPSDMRFLVYRIIVLPGLAIPRNGRQVRDMQQSNIPNALTTVVPSSSYTTWHGTLDSNYDAVKGSDGVLFEYDRYVTLTFAQGVSESGGSHAKGVLSVEINNQPKRLLKLSNCIVANTTKKRLLKYCSTEEDVKGVIEKNGSYWAYGWLKASGWVSGFIPDGNTKVTYSSNDADYVYFAAQSVNPVQSLVT